MIALDYIASVTATVEPNQRSGIDVYVWLAGSSNRNLVALVNSPAYQRSWPGSHSVSDKFLGVHHTYAPRRFPDGVAHYYDVVTVYITNATDLTRALMSLMTIQSVAGFCNNDVSSDNWIDKNDRAGIVSLAHKLTAADRYRY